MTTRTVDATVIALIPEYRQAELRAVDGTRFALTEHTPGIALANVREGQHYRCTVTLRFAKVLHAELLIGGSSE